jgi:hypothetical protein
MFAFLKRPAHTVLREHASPGFAHTEAAIDKPGWTDSASDLLKGADVVEYSGDFAATVILEHFAEPASVARPT